MRFRSLVLAVLVAAPFSASCGKEKLTDVSVPEAGVTLRYDVAPGQAYAGHLRMRNAVQTPMGDIIQTIEFDVDLVAGQTEADKTLMAATVSGIKLDVRVPDGMPAAMVGNFNQETAQTLNGMEVRFKLGERGNVSEMPDPPASAAPELKGIIGMVSGALSAAFVRVPEAALKAGDTWDAAKDSEPEPGVESTVTGTGTFNGLARDEGGEEVARLAYSMQVVAKRKTEAGEQEVTTKQEAEALFSALGGFPTKVERKINGEIKGVGGMLSEVNASWTKLDKRAAPAASGGDEQAITDPCDPDYVGGEECVEAPAP